MQNVYCGYRMLVPNDLQTAKLATHIENGLTAFFRSESPLSMFHAIQIKDI